MNLKLSRSHVSADKEGWCQQLRDRVETLHFRLTLQAQIQMLAPGSNRQLSRLPTDGHYTFNPRDSRIDADQTIAETIRSGRHACPDALGCEIVNDIIAGKTNGRDG